MGHIIVIRQLNLADILWHRLIQLHGKPLGSFIQHDVLLSCGSAEFHGYGVREYVFVYDELFWGNDRLEAALAFWRATAGSGT